MTVKKMILSSEEKQSAGQAVITTTQSWTVPEGISSLSILGVEPGQAGASGSGGSNTGSGGVGGIGGSIRFLNNVPVSSGQSIQISFTTTGFSVTVNGSIILTGLSGGVSLGRAGSGGKGANGGNIGGGGGGSGGGSASLVLPSTLVPGYYGQDGGGLGPTTSGGPGGTGLFPGGGGGGGGGSGSDGSVAPGSGGAGGAGGGGCVRIIWPGTARSFPSTRTADEVSGEISWSLITHPEGSLSTFPFALATDGAGTWIMLPSVTSASVTYYISTDNGKSFSARSFGVTTQGLLRSVTYCGSGVWVVGTQSGTLIRSSDNALTWSVVTVPGVGNIGTTTYGNGILIIGSVKTIRRSTDKGLTFSSSTTATISGNALGSAYGNNIFLMGDNTGNPKKSVDNGLNFTAMASGLFSNGGVDLRSFYSEGYFMGVVGGLNSSTPGVGQVYIGNNDATAYSYRPLPIIVNGAIYDITHASSRFLAGGALSRFLEMKDGTTTWGSPSTISNNLVGLGLTIGQIESDGFGVTIVAGNYGLMMRGELK